MAPRSPSTGLEHFTSAMIKYPTPGLSDATQRSQYLVKSRFWQPHARTRTPHLLPLVRCRIVDDIDCKDSVSRH